MTKLQTYSFSFFLIIIPFGLSGGRHGFQSHVDAQEETCQKSRGGE